MRNFSNFHEKYQEKLLELEKLILFNSRINQNDLTIIAELADLAYLDLTGTAINDLSVLSKLKNVSKIIARGTGAKECPFINTCDF